MGPQNLTSVSEFLLLGLSEDPELQPLLFGMFLSMYLVAVAGNLLITVAVISDPYLHTPMYFFLSNLSLADIGFTSTTVPKVLVNTYTHQRDISYVGCVIQLSFLYLFACVDSLLLMVMAYDRFVAICHPLYYPVIMNFHLCGLLVLVSFFTSFFSLPATLRYGIGVYLSSAVSPSLRKGAVASVMFTVATPMLNPFIYSLRNTDIKRALKRLLRRIF
ncbi:olfactory receptor 7A17-like [Elephas maximus indicus]|uniref:olfactory receptor 7A17-like n=1 Tax=Elephas maximus indicus TaxID=99487 RepID=UPI002116B393|nr:olfactory receptor 7A17-like [Elephas maximus indicus]